MVEARATARYVRISPRRAQDVIDLIRGKNAEEALNILSFTSKRAASYALNVLRSAISNATKKDKDAKVEALVVVNAYVGQGPVLKRFNIRARGRVDMLRRRTSHICIMLSTKNSELRIKQGKLKP